MTQIPWLSYLRITHALHRDGWTAVRTPGSHIRLQKHVGDQVLKITLPAHRPVKRSILRHILIQARLDVDKFLDLL